MKYPSVLLLPVLMFADYFLTVLGAIRREKKYSQHFKTEHYELNPIWQKSIARKKWFNPRHTLLVIVLSSVLIAFFEFGDLGEAYSEFLIGAVLVAYTSIVARHISNLLIFRHLARHPDQIAGQITLSHSLSLAMSMYQTVLVALPIALIAIFTRSIFAIGGMAGIGLFLLANLRWIRKARKQALRVPPTAALIPSGSSHAQGPAIT